MVIFSHRGIGFGKRENSIAAFESALSGGFSIEADIRLKDVKAVLSHDEAGGSLAAEGLDNDEIAKRLDTRRKIVSMWRKRFFEDRLEGLEERSRPGRPRSISP